VGVGFITWALAKQPELLDVVLAYAPPAAVMFSFGDCGAYIPRVQAADALAIAQVRTLTEARQVAAAGVDIIVAQGTEGGGHGGARATFSLVPAVVDAVAPIPVVAAGGVADGRGLAAALMLGAAGVLMGTRFYATPEALGLENAKRAMIECGGDDTRRTHVFDIVRGYDWPDGITGRAINNRFLRDWHGREDALAGDLERQRKRYTDAAAAGDAKTAVVFAGEALDLIAAIEPADTIVARIVSEAEALLQHSSS
jgi:nitronate monooxygenase